MRVHIVCERVRADRILPRMVRYLADGCGWSVGQHPDPSADANYFFNYLVWIQRHHEWRETPVGGFFTHRDEANQRKAELWDQAARGVDLRTVCAQMYADLLRPHGLTATVRPPVELDKFVIRPRITPSRPVVGVSGYTYGDNRKGEKLVAKLARSELGGRIELKASGRGWPVPTQSYPWEQMPNFYRSLDVLLVPSMWEGIHMPTLEALACGVKVVLPPVGILGELPDVEGIYRYKTGDLGDMIRALEEAAFSGPVDREALRAVALPYSLENWCRDHAEAFEALLYGLRAEPEDLPDWQGNAGIYLVAFGKPSRQCAVRAIESIHRHMPGLPVCLCSDHTLGPEDVFVRQPDTDIGGRIAKLKVDDLAPAEWRYVLYLDADTEVVGDISFLFEVLQDGWELVICKDMAKYDSVKMMLRPDNHDEAEATWRELGTDQALQYNGGMMAFRRSARTAEFFRLWQAEWQRWGKRDQGALLRALHAHPLKAFVLCNQWNASMRYPLPAGEIAIKHHNTEARRWTGLIEGRLDSKLAWRRVSQWNGRRNE